MAENEQKGNGASPEADVAHGEGAEAGGERGAQTVTLTVDELEAVEAKVGQLEKERAEAHERMLRTAAEFENWKKRTKREVDEAAARGREQLAKEILPVLDNFERALLALSTGGTVEQLGKGVQLVEKQLQGALEKFEIKGFEAAGEPFDPAKHEAIQQLETAEVAPGAVAKVFARGYMIGARLLRPAMVAVAKAPSGAEPGSGGDGSASGG